LLLAEANRNEIKSFYKSLERRFIYNLLGLNLILKKNYGALGLSQLHMD